MIFEDKRFLILAKINWEYY